MLLIITKTNAGHKFYCTKFSVIDFFHTDRRSLFRYMAKNWPVAKITVGDFRAQPRGTPLLNPGT